MYFTLRARATDREEKRHVSSCNRSRLVDLRDRYFQLSPLSAIRLVIYLDIRLCDDRPTSVSRSSTACPFLRNPFKRFKRYNFYSPWYIYCRSDLQSREKCGKFKNLLIKCTLINDGKLKKKSYLLKGFKGFAELDCEITSRTLYAHITRVLENDTLQGATIRIERRSRKSYTRHVFFFLTPHIIIFS